MYAKFIIGKSTESPPTFLSGVFPLAKQNSRMIPNISQTSVELIRWVSCTYREKIELTIKKDPIVIGDIVEETKMDV